MSLQGWGRRALPSLLVLALTACGSQPPGGAGAKPPADPARPAAKAPDARPSAGRAAAPGGAAAAPRPGEPLGKPWAVSTDPYAWDPPLDGPAAAPAPSAASAPAPEASPAAVSAEVPTTPLGMSPTAPSAPAAAPLAPTAFPSFRPIGVGGLVAFASNRATGGDAGPRDFDVYLYDIAAAAVITMPGVNSAGDEINPRLSDDGKWLVYATNKDGDFDVELCNIGLKAIDALAGLNSTGNEVAPTVTADGDKIAFRTDRSGRWTLGVYSLPTSTVVMPPTVAALGTPIRDPWIAGDGSAIAFVTDGKVGGTDVYVYRSATDDLISPPFLNSPAMESDPALSHDGSRVLFASDRDGPANIAMANLVTGLVDQLALANTPATEREPRFLGTSNDYLVYVTDFGGANRLQVFDMVTGISDQLPISQDIGADGLLEDVRPVLGGTGVGGPGVGGAGAGGAGAAIGSPLGTTWGWPGLPLGRQVGRPL